MKNEFLINLIGFLFFLVGSISIIVLKYLNIISWSWAFVLLPFSVPGILILLIIAILFGFLIVDSIKNPDLFGWTKNKDNEDKND